MTDVSKLVSEVLADDLAERKALVSAARKILKEIDWSDNVVHVGLVSSILRKYEVTRK
jgi:hypothetical protein